MPTLVEVLQTTPAAVKLSLSIYLFGFAFSQLVCGPLSDAFGRRPVALSYFSIYFLGSVVALLAPSITWLLVGRALQGIGVAAGVAVSRAIVRDQFSGQRSAHIMNLIGLILAVGPAISPTVGGVLLNAFGWHSIFLLMALYGIATLFVMGFLYVETNTAPDPAQAYPRKVAQNYAMLLTTRSFMAGGLVLGFAIGAFYTLAAMLPFVLMELVGLTPTEFGGLLMLFQTGSYALGAFVTGRLLRRYEAAKLIPVGLTLIAVAALSFGIGLRLLPLSWHRVIASVALWSSGSALVIPGATMIALAGFPKIAGAASALVGFLPIGIGLAGTALAALLFNDPLTALETVMPSMGILALLAHLGLRPKRMGVWIRFRRVAFDATGFFADRVQAESFGAQPGGKDADASRCRWRRR